MKIAETSTPATFRTPPASSASAKAKDADRDSDGTKAGTGHGEATTVTLSRAATQALAQARSPAANTSTSASSSSAGNNMAALKAQEAKLVAQIKATQNDKSLDSEARVAKVAQLNAQKRQIDEQLKRP